MHVEIFRLCFRFNSQLKYQQFMLSNGFFSLQRLKNRRIFKFYYNIFSFPVFFLSWRRSLVIIIIYVKLKKNLRIYNYILYILYVIINYYIPLYTSQRIRTFLNTTFSNYSDIFFFFWKSKKLSSKRFNNVYFFFPR